MAVGDGPEPYALRTVGVPHPPSPPPPAGSTHHGPFSTAAHPSGRPRSLLPPGVHRPPVVGAGSDSPHTDPPARKGGDTTWRTSWTALIDGTDFGAPLHPSHRDTFASKRHGASPVCPADGTTISIGPFPDRPPGPMPVDTRLPHPHERGPHPVRMMAGRGHPGERKRHTFHHLHR